MPRKTAFLTAMFEHYYMPVLGSSVQAWVESLGEVDAYVVCSPDFVDEVSKMTDAFIFHGFEKNAYGACYSHAISTLTTKGYKHFIIAAPYSVPSNWLIGSLQAWMQDFDIVGIYKPPRILKSPEGITIFELGRLQMDFLYLSKQAAICADFEFKSFEFGSLLIRARPGGWLLFNALAFGNIRVLTLPQHVKPIIPISKNYRRERFERNHDMQFREKLKEFKGGPR